MYRFALPEVIDAPIVKDTPINDTTREILKSIMEGKKEAPELPKLHDVFLLNDADDSSGTPYTVVIDALVQIFGMNSGIAFKTMIIAHKEGKAFVVKMSADLAEEKCVQAKIFAGKYPLTFTHEPE
jgi:ATP-dependent Clp protease adapter protein ClpS